MNAQVKHVGCLAALAMVGACLCACAGSAGDPNAPLTADQGDALLREVRDDPGRVQSLTPAERRYLGTRSKR